MFIDRPDSYWVLSMDAVFLCASRFSITYRKAAMDPTRGLEGSQCSAPASSWRWYANHHTNKSHISDTHSLSDWSTARMTTKRKTHPYSRATSVGTEREREASLTTRAVDDGMETNSMLSVQPQRPKQNVVAYLGTAAEPLKKTALDLIQTVFFIFMKWLITKFPEFDYNNNELGSRFWR